MYWRVGGAQATYSVLFMVKIIRKDLKALISLDATFFLDFEFLATKVEGLLFSKCYLDVLNIFPQPQPLSDLKPFVELIQLVQTTKQSPIVLALPSAGKDCSSVIRILQGIDDKVAPCSKDVSKYSDFLINILKRLEAYCQDERDIPPKGKTKATRQLLYGREALIEKFTRDSKQVESGKNLGVGDLVVYKQFLWLLTPTEQVTCDTWLKSAVREHRLSIETGRIKDGTVGDEADGVGSGGAKSLALVSLGCSSSGGSSSSKALAIVKPLPSKKKLDESVVKAQADQMSFMKLFGSKALAK
jgi:hypothetical protein